MAAAILLAAAAGKCYDIVTEGLAGQGFYFGRWFAVVLVETEWLGAVALVFFSRVFPNAACLVTTASFSAFALASLSKSAMGEPSCGCFGNMLKVNSVHMAAFDLAMVLCLIRWRPTMRVVARRRPRLLARSACALAVWISVAVLGGLAMAGRMPTRLSSAGQVVEGKRVLLTPDTWVGKRFPLLPFIEDSPHLGKAGKRPLRERLKDGSWLVVLYHHDCGRCAEKLPRYARLAEREGARQGGARIALIELPPFGAAGAIRLPSDATFCHGRLSDDKTWFVDTPTEIVLNAGVAASVRRAASGARP